MIFHNLSGYDSHLFVKCLNVNGGGQIDCIPNIEEKYIRFSKSIYNDENKFKYKIVFIDSFEFMWTSLDKLIKNINENQFKHTRKHLAQAVKTVNSRWEKVFILMTTLTVLIKNNFHQKKHFIQSWTTVKFQMKAMNMHKSLEICWYENYEIF